MNATRLSILEQARGGDDTAWRTLVALDQPLVRGWLLNQGVEPQDAEDVAQDVMTVLVRKLPEFEHAGRTGSFRLWLRTVATNCTRSFWRAGRCRLVQGGVLPEDDLDQVADSESDLAKAWDAEYDRHVFRSLIDFLDGEYDTATVQIFRRLVLDDAKPADVAAEAGMTVVAVYGIKARLLAKLRQEAAGILDEFTRCASNPARTRHFNGRAASGRNGQVDGEPPSAAGDAAVVRPRRTGSRRIGSD